MKIGLIADIHADLEALELALMLMEQHGVQQILCAGDLVDKGKHGDAVVQRIRDLRIPCVLGNHDGLARVTQEWYRRSDPTFVPSTCCCNLRASLF
jgi:predicted phosphodiesterase